MLWLRPKALLFFSSTLFIVFCYLFNINLVFAQNVRTIINGVQLPDSSPITEDRLSAAPFKFGWVKYQYALGSDQPIEAWIDTARKDGYQVLVSVAKNQAGIPTLGAPSPWSHQYCPWPEELEHRAIYGTDAEGNQIQIGEEIEPEPWGNGYMEFRERMKDLVARLGPTVGAYEIWNEPNTLLEWTDQGLGPINPANYARFMECGIKGAKRNPPAGSNPLFLSAALAPLSGDYDDQRFFNEFVDAGGLSDPWAPDAIGWHSNVVKNIAPIDPSLEGFQRVKLALNHGKPVWITEFGWDRRGAGINRSLQASYITEAFKIGPTLGEINAMFVWNFGFGKLLGDSHPFYYWDIEGIETTTECSPGSLKLFAKAQINYVGEPTLQDDAESVKTWDNTLLPDTYNQSVTQQLTKDAVTTPEVKIDVVSGFLAPIASVVKNILCSFTGHYCTPIISVGDKEDLIENKVTGKNTDAFAKTSGALSQAYDPVGIAKTPDLQDCNLLDIVSPGNDYVDEVSKSLGTQAGFYSDDRPQLTDYDQLLKARKTTDNLYIDQKQFTGDERSPGIDTTQCIWDETVYPSGLLHTDGKCNEPELNTVVNDNR